MPEKKCQIRILPRGRLVEARAGTNLMESLMDQGIFLRSDCGGKGICKKCRVKVASRNSGLELKKACTFMVSEDVAIKIPEISMLSSHIINKAPVSLGPAFKKKFRNARGKKRWGIAADIGTTTIAVYLCDIKRGRVISSLSVKNPQALYGDDVMSRISAIARDKKNLGHLQKLVVRAVEWGIKKLLARFDQKEAMISKALAVGNPTMIHILAGIDPESIGVFPYLPAFYEAKNFRSSDLGFKIKDFSIQVLPQVSGFIGGDILSAAIAIGLEQKPEGTLLIDLGTNGELMLKGKDRLFATSCATGPAFEGASLSCGMQAVPGAINKVQIKTMEGLPGYTFINPSNSPGLKPSGICGTGVISAVAQFCKKSIIEPGGLFNKDGNIFSLKKDDQGKMQYMLAPEGVAEDNAVFISQKDIRSVQLGKAALITGIEFLLKEAGLVKPGKIIIAGAFGTYLDKEDMTGLGMIPPMEPGQVEFSGNLAGAGAVMALCDKTFTGEAIKMAAKISVVDLACNRDFQEVFINKLSFLSY
ncbi:MAG: DUF4445 domain-containing protein [Deltaproteobacteria bacterium]|nr:DUF4445 domain-containing protein [Deltaproteobacteria bacterium]